MEEKGAGLALSLTLPSHFSAMKLCTGLVFCSLVLGVSSHSWLSFLGEAYEGKVAGGGTAPWPLGFPLSALQGWGDCVRWWCPMC